MIAKVTGFTRTAEWRDEVQYEVHLSVAGRAVDLPVDAGTFRSLYRDFVAVNSGHTPDNSTVFFPPAELVVDIEVRTIR